MITTKKCIGCQGDFEIETGDSPVEVKLQSMIKHCPKCSEQAAQKRNQESAAKHAEDFEAKWRDFCPPIFQETEISKLPMPHKAYECLKWDGQKGLTLFGNTRRGKSRCAWLLMRREFEKKRKITVMDSLSGFDYGSQFALSAAAAEAWVMARCRADLLFLDDVFKVKLTDSFEAAMFAIIDYRLNHKKTIVATCNDTGDSLAARMSNDRGAAFVARLKESCTTIQF